MDKYETMMRVEEIRRLANIGQYKKALKILDTIDVNKRRIITELNIYADVYAQNGRFDDARNVLLRIYEKSNSRRVVSKLVDVSIKRADLEEAEDFYNEYLEVAGEDSSRFIFQYQLDKLQGKSVELLIDSLRSFMNYEYDEKWALELAKLYHKAGDKNKCIEECSKLILWFGEGIYVDQAKILRDHYTGKISSVTQLNQTYESSKEGEKRTKTDKSCQPNSPSSKNKLERHLSEEVIQVMNTMDDQGEQENQDSNNPLSIEYQNMYPIKADIDKEIQNEYIQDMEEDIQEDVVQEVNIQGSQIEENQSMLEVEENKASNIDEFDMLWNTFGELEVISEKNESLSENEEDSNEEVPDEKKLDEKDSDEDGRNHTVQSCLEVETIFENPSTLGGDSLTIKTIPEKKNIDNNNSSNCQNTINKGLQVDCAYNKYEKRDSIGIDQDKEEFTKKKFQEKFSFFKNFGKNKKEKEKKLNIGDKLQDMLNAVNEISSENSSEDNSIKNEHIENNINTRVNTTKFDREKQEEQVVQSSDDIKEKTMDESQDKSNIQLKENKEQEDSSTDNQDETIEQTSNESVDKELDICQDAEEEQYNNAEKSEELDEYDTVDKKIKFAKETKNQLTEKAKEPNILPDDDIIFENINISKIFKNFIKIPSIKVEIMNSLELVKRNEKYSNNFLIFGSDQSGKTELAKMCSKVLFKQGKLNTPKLAKITASKLNQIDLLAKKSNLVDGCVIIEQAGDLSDSSIEQIIAMIDEYDANVSFMLEDTKFKIDGLFENNKKFYRYFAHQIHIPIYQTEELLGFAYSYLSTIEYDIEDEVSDILINIANNINNECPDDGRLMAMLDCIEYAKAKCDIRNKDDLMKIVSSGKYDESELSKLKAIDFTE